MNKKHIAAALIIVIAIIAVFFIFSSSNSSTSIEATGADGRLVVDGESISADNGDYSTNLSNTNTVLVQNGGELKLTNSKITKTGSSDSTSSASNSDSDQSAASNGDSDQSSDASKSSSQPPDMPSDSGFGDGGSADAAPENGEDGISNAPENGGASNGGAPESGGASNGGAPESGGASNGGAPENGGGSNTEDSEFYGTNAAILTLYDSVSEISNCVIQTDANGANAIFATNNDSSHSGATTKVKDVEIQTYQDKSRGLDATYGATITADNVNINTRGGSCAAVATDRGEGTVNVSNSKLNTGVENGSGAGSPCIYSTGAISATKCTGTAYGSQIACIEGKNSANLDECDLTCYAKGNRESNGEYVDLGAVFIYQSMSGDADEGTAVFNCDKSTLSIAEDSEYFKTAPMFHITNTKANITISDTTLKFGSDILLNASGQDQWGQTDSNGGDVQFTASNEDLSGNIIVDSISSLNFDLNESKYSGAINPSDSYGNTTVSIGENSQWTLTGDSHISSLDNQGTINYGDYTLYVNGKAYTASNPYNA